MLTKRLLTLSLVLLLAAVSATAFAGSTITDKSYWPNEARRSAQARIGDVNSAFAYDRAAPRVQPEASAITAGPVLRYQGGPKFH
jgi:hypothetical protein